MDFLSFIFSTKEIIAQVYQTMQQPDPREDVFACKVVTVMHAIAHSMFYPDVVHFSRQAWMLCLSWALLLDRSSTEFRYKSELPANVKRCYSEMHGVGMAWVFMREYMGATDIATKDVTQGSRTADCTCKLPGVMAPLNIEFECKGSCVDATMTTAIKKGLTQVHKLPALTHPIAGRDRQSPNYVLATFIGGPNATRRSRMRVYDPLSKPPLFSHMQVQLLLYGVTCCWCGLRDLGQQLVVRSGWLQLDPDRPESRKGLSGGVETVWLDHKLLAQDPAAYYRDPTEALKVDARLHSLAESEVVNHTKIDVEGRRYAVSEVWTAPDGLEVSVGVDIDALLSLARGDTTEADAIDAVHRGRNAAHLSRRTGLCWGPGGSLMRFTRANYK